MSDARPSVSVMIPVYNGCDTLPLAIQSLQLQTFRDWEAIVVDDGSTDGLPDFVETLTDSRIRFIRHERNLGRAAARQTALDACKGRYLAFLDADDIYHPEKLERQFAILEGNPNLALVSCTMASYDAAFKLRSIRTAYPFRPHTLKAKSTFPYSRAGSMVRRELLVGMRYDLSLRYAEDTDIIERAFIGKKIASVPNVLYYYSEFSSTNPKKIILSNIYSIKRSVKKIPGSPIKASIGTMIEIFKCITKLTMLPFVNVDVIVASRGTSAPPEMENEFRKTLNAINDALEHKIQAQSLEKY